MSTTPTRIDLSDSTRTFVVEWDDGAVTRVPYRELRQRCRCAVCVEELTGKQLLDTSTVPETIGVADCKEVGLYGVQLTFTDKHGTGIYTWERLRSFGETTRP